MDFPLWAPARLRSEYEAIFQGQNSFSEENFSGDELTRYAQKNGFPTWHQYKGFLVIYRESLGRMLTNENARSVWEWIADERVIGLVWRRVTIRLESWCREPVLTNKEFIDERDEIAKLSAQLAGKLSKNLGSHWLMVTYAGLVPEAYREQAIKALHPDLIKLAEDRNRAPGFYIGVGLPPLHVMLNRLSELTANATIERDRPRKIHSDSALRQLLLKDICRVLYGNGCEHSTTNLATFLYLILDDESITDATIRGDLKGEEWW